MKTLADLIEAVKKLPLEAFEDSLSGHMLRELIVNRGMEYRRSPLCFDHHAAEEKKRLHRRKKDMVRSLNRDVDVRKWIKGGDIVPGTFIKVLGARDGKGIRQVVDIETDRLTCRQWMPIAFGELRQVQKDPDGARNAGYLKIADVWIKPQSQMMTHDFNKVVKLLG